MLICFFTDSFVTKIAYWIEIVCKSNIELIRVELIRVDSSLPWPLILKIYAKELSWPLTYLFNLSFTLGEVPLIWKRANITPVFKANAKENVENYRSISLLSILGKYQERIVHRVVYSHVSPFLNSWQHGFVKGRSCITQLVLTLIKAELR